MNKSAGGLTDEQIKEIAQQEGDESEHGYIFNKDGCYSIHSFARALLSRSSVEQPFIEFVDSWECKHTMTPAEAARMCKEYYDAWPGGLEEIESALRTAARQESAQPAPMPVAWVNKRTSSCIEWNSAFDLPNGTALYAAHPEREKEFAKLLSEQDETYNRQTNAMIARHAKQIEELRKDSERYRWLRDAKNDVALVLDKCTGYVPPDYSVPGVGGYNTYEYRAGKELDDAIDAAIAASKSIGKDEK